MSSTKQTTVWCDDCALWEQATGTAKALRAQLKRAGWIVVKQPDGEHQDLCPSCAAKRKGEQHEPR